MRYKKRMSRILLLLFFGVFVGCIIFLVASIQTIQ